VTWTAGGTASAPVLLGAASDRYRIAGLANGVPCSIAVQATGPGGQGTPALATGTPLAFPGAGLRDVRADGSGRITVDFSAADNGSGAVTCEILLNDAPAWSGGCGGDGSATLTGLADDTEYQVVLRATNGRGAAVSAARPVRTWGPRRVTISKGPNALGDEGTDCKSQWCHWVVVHIENFTPGQEYVMNADSTMGGGFSERRIAPGPDGQATACGYRATYYFGYVGHQIWVSVDGVVSDRLTW